LCGIKKTFSWFGFDLYEYLCVVTETFLGWLIKKSVDHVFAKGQAFQPVKVESRNKLF